MPPYGGGKIPHLAGVPNSGGLTRSLNPASLPMIPGDNRRQNQHNTRAARIQITNASLPTLLHPTGWPVHPQSFAPLRRFDLFGHLSTCSSLNRFPVGKSPPTLVWFSPLQTMHFSVGISTLRARWGFPHYSLQSSMGRAAGRLVRA